MSGPLTRTACNCIQAAKCLSEFNSFTLSVRLLKSSITRNKSRYASPRERKLSNRLFSHSPYDLLVVQVKTSSI
jgi:hypothetical protein